LRGRGVAPFESPQLYFVHALRSLRVVAAYKRGEYNSQLADGQCNRDFFVFLSELAIKTYQFVEAVPTSIWLVSNLMELFDSFFARRAERGTHVYRERGVKNFTSIDCVYKRARHIALDNRNERVEKLA
jgi:hypothetical protein